MKITEKQPKLFRLMDWLEEKHHAHSCCRTVWNDIMSRLFMLPLLVLTASHHKTSISDLTKGPFHNWPSMVVNLNNARRSGFINYSDYRLYRDERQKKLDSLVKRMCQDLEKAGGCQEQWNSDCMSCLNARMCSGIDSIAESYLHSNEPIPDYSPNWH